MAHQFIGLHMMVTLRSGQQMKGTVSDVLTGQSLILSNVFQTLPTQKWFPRLVINAADIVDLSEVRTDSAPRPPTAEAFTAPPAAPIPAPVVPEPAQPAFVDPAIVSLGKRPDASKTPTQESQDAQNRPNTSEKRDPQPGQPGVLPPLHLRQAGSRGPTPKTAAVVQSMKGLNIDMPADVHDGPDAEGVEEGTQDMAAHAHRKKKRSQRNRTGRPEDAQDSSPARGGPTNRGKGWRETPMLQSTASFQPFNSLKRNGGKGSKDEGWASEDVTEEMGDFDFEGGLAKFDKRTIFDQMRKEDQIDEADRLVSHNRRAKPGTAGGKNLHYSENVLDLPSAVAKPPGNDFWNSEADDTLNDAEQRHSGRELGSRQSNRRAESKTSVARRSQSRKASAAAGATAATGQPLPRVNSGQQPSQPSFYLVPSNRRLETVSALQMLNLENIAANEIGLTEAMMTEHAGRGIAEVAITALSDPAIQVRLGAVPNNTTLTTATLASSATVVILAGSNKSGIRAVAAGRMLRNKGVNVLLCVVGIEREQNLLEDMRTQIRIFRNMGGRVYSKIELFEHIRQASTTKIAGHPGAAVTLIVDALLGLTISFDELRTGDQATVYELIEWANRNEAFVLAVDVPTGIDPSSGRVSIIDGSSLYVKPRYVVAVGAPKRGLLEAMAPPTREGDGANELGGVAGGDGAAQVADEDEWKLFLADLGLGAAVWKKAGTKIRRGIDFDDKWVLEMRYQGVAVAEE